MQSQMGRLYHAHSPRFRGHIRRENRDMVRARRGRGAVSSGHDRTAVLMNSHSCGHLHKTKLADFLAWSGRGQEPHP